MSFKRKSMLLVAGILAVTLMIPVQEAKAQATGSTAVSFNFPDIIVLHYLNSLTQTFTGGSLTGVNEGSGTDSQALATTAIFTTTITPSAPTGYPQTIAVIDDDVWAVRGITSTGIIKVAATLDIPAAVNGGSTATMKNLVVRSGGSSGQNINVAAPGFTPTLGGIGYNLDISAVTTSGAHTGAQYTITATVGP